MKAQRNKTIDFDLDVGEPFLKRCITVANDVSIQQIINKTIIGDTFDVLDYLPNEFADLIIADPPYNLSKNYNGNKFNKVSYSKYIEYTDGWIKKIFKLLKNNGSIYVCCDWKSSSSIEMVLKDYFVIQNRITWQREKGRGALNNWKNAMEDIWFASKSKEYTFNVDRVKIRRKVIAPYKIDGKPKDWEETQYGNFRNTYPSNFWDDISIPYWSMPENTAHPTQKPEKLIAKLILASSNENDIILDPFLGSGTTSVVAKKLKRKYVGIEQNKQYCAWAEKRIEDAKYDNIIQGYANGVFWERNTSNLQKKFE
ncbi:MAG: site-specific DNA-methyltransferase [Lachnospiraceae bacterium]|nr:site-specific DNA-methyltransferase [Lachnospiraceae bacterium]